MPFAFCQFHSFSFLSSLAFSSRFYVSLRQQRSMRRFQQDFHTPLLHLWLACDGVWNRLSLWCLQHHSNVTWQLYGHHPFLAPVATYRSTAVNKSLTWMHLATIRRLAHAYKRSILVHSTTRGQACTYRNWSRFAYFGQRRLDLTSQHPVHRAPHCGQQLVLYCQIGRRSYSYLLYWGSRYVIEHKTGCPGYPR